MTIAQRFGLSGETQVLPGGSVEVSRIGNVVLKHIRETSLENNHSPQLARWIAEFSASLPQNGFRLPRGVRAGDGDWITEDGWTAWTFVDGQHAEVEDIPACIDAINALNTALRLVPKHPLMDHNVTVWGYAHRACLGKRPDRVLPVLEDVVDALYALRRPIPAEHHQLIHGDLNPENILIVPNQTPAFIDFSPFWGPPELAIAIFASFIGPRRGDPSVLPQFSHVPQFNQMLIRAAIRMVLVVDGLEQQSGLTPEAWDTSSENQAARIVIDWIQRQGEITSDMDY